MNNFTNNLVSKYEERHKTKLHIKSDGTPAGTVILTESGEMISNVVKIVWECEADNSRLSTATITLVRVEVDVVGWEDKKGNDD